MYNEQKDQYRSINLSENNTLFTQENIDLDIQK